MPATAALPYPDTAYFEPPRRIGSGARTGVFAVLIVLVLVVLAAIFLLLLTDSGGDGGGGQTPVVSAVPVPNLIGKAQAEAEAQLKGIGLTSTVELKDNADVEPGKVFAQTPVGGNKVASGTQVVLTVSKGKTANPMPQVIGLQVAAAEALLRGQFQLDVALVPELKSTRPEGEVLTQNVVSGATVQVGSKVILTYSAP